MRVRGQKQKIYVSSLRSKCEKPPEILCIKRVRLIIPARKGISIVARVHWQKQTRYVYILRSKVLNVESTRNAFYETRAVRVRWHKQKRYVYILRSKCGKPPETLSIKHVRFIILARKGISIVARVRWQKQTRYVYILRSKRGKPPEMLSVKRVRFITLARKGISIVAKVH